MHLISGMLFLFHLVAILLIMLEIELTEYLTKEQSCSDSMHAWRFLHTCRWAHRPTSTLYILNVHAYSWFWVNFLKSALCFSLLHIREHNLKRKSQQTQLSSNHFLCASFPLYALPSPFSLLHFISWKCPVLLGGWLCQMWHIHHLVIGFVIKCFCLVDHKGHSILPN